MTVNQAGHHEEHREEQRPTWCHRDHMDLSTRVGKVEAQVMVIETQFQGLRDQVFNMQSMMIEVRRATGDMAATAQVLRSEMSSIKDMMALIHKYEESGGLFEWTRKIGSMVGVVVQLATLGGIAWAVLMFAKRLP